MPKIVSIHYSPQRWNQLLKEENNRLPTKSYRHMFESSGFSSRFESRSRSSNSSRESLSISPPAENLNKIKKESTPTMDVNTLTVQECLDRMSQYHQLLKSSIQKDLENEWLGEVNVLAHKLQLIRELYKTVQSVNRKRNMIKNSTTSLFIALASESTPIPSDAIEIEEDEEEDEEDEVYNNMTSSKLDVSIKSSMNSIMNDDNEHDFSGSASDALA